MSAVIGVAPLIIPAVDEATHCSARENNDSGTAIHNAPMRATLNQSARAIG